MLKIRLINQRFPSRFALRDKPKYGIFNGLILRAFICGNFGKRILSYFLFKAAACKSGFVLTGLCNITQ